MHKDRETKERLRNFIFAHSAFADLSLLLVAIVWGSSYSVAKTALAYMPVLAFLFIRFAITSVVMLPVTWRSLSRQPVATLKVGVPLGLILFFIFICETAGIANTTASNAAFLISLCVVLTPIVEGITFRRFPGWGILGAAALSCVGAGLLALQGGYEFNLGDWLMLGAALLRACMVTATKKMTEGKLLDSGALTVVQMITVSALTGFAISTLGIESFALPLQPVFWIATLYLCVVCTLFPFYIQTHMVRKTTPTRVSLLMGTEPVFGALFAVALLSETLSLQSLMGGALIVIATYIGIRQENAKA
ncbi:MAG: DMT family transporter [Phormidesmis sp.]